MAMDIDGSHGTNGTPHTRGSFACGTPSHRARVERNHMGRVTVKPIQPLLKPQYAAVPIEDPMIRIRQIISLFLFNGVVSPLT